MKKLVSLFVLVGMTTAATAAPSYIQPDRRGGYNVTYDYTDKAKTGWYMTARAEISFLNWKNKYSSDLLAVGADLSSNSDSYSFEPVFGGSLAAGRHFGYFWRGEVEAGYIGHFEDKDNVAEFSLQIPYVSANGYYDFLNGVYVGGGLGIAAPMTTLDIKGANIWSDGTSRSKTSIAPMANIAVGYSTKLDDNLILDLRYRLAGMTGTKHSIGIKDNTPTYGNFENKIDMIWDNSISVGVRYEF